MSTNDRYESRIRKAALLGGLENGLRDGGKCLICQCWRKPCTNCNTAARNGNADDSRPRDAASHGKSLRYQEVAARLRLKLFLE